MQRIESATRVPDLHGPGKDGFTAGDPLTGTPATSMSAAMWNSLQEELAGVVETFLGPLDPVDHTQLRRAIAAAILASGVVGKVNKTGDDMSGLLAIVTNAAQIALRNTANDATARQHQTFLRGDGSGSYGEFVSLGNAANGVADLRLRLMSAVGAVLSSFEFKSNGRFLLGADPVLPLEAATKQFVQSLLPAAATNPEALALAVAGKYVSPSNLGALVASTSQRGLVALATAAQARAKLATNVAMTPSNIGDLAFESAEIAITQQSTANVPHGLGIKPKSVAVYLRCKNAVEGFSVNEESLAGWNYTLSGLEYGVVPSIVDATNISYTVGDRVPVVYKRTAPIGDATTITAADWRIVLRAYS